MDGTVLPTVEALAVVEGLMRKFSKHMFGEPQGGADGQARRGGAPEGMEGASPDDWGVGSPTDFEELAGGRAEVARTVTDRSQDRVFPMVVGRPRVVQHTGFGGELEV